MSPRRGETRVSSLLLTQKHKQNKTNKNASGLDEAATNQRMYNFQLVLSLQDAVRAIRRTCRSNETSSTAPGSEMHGCCESRDGEPPLRPFPVDSRWGDALQEPQPVVSSCQVLFLQLQTSLAAENKSDLKRSQSGGTRDEING